VFLPVYIALPVGGKLLGYFPPAPGVRLAYVVSLYHPESLIVLIPEQVERVGPTLAESVLLDPPVLVAIIIGLVPPLPVRFRSLGQACFAAAVRLRYSRVKLRLVLPKVLLRLTRRYRLE